MIVANGCAARHLAPIVALALVVSCPDADAQVAAHAGMHGAGHRQSAKQADAPTQDAGMKPGSPTASAPSTRPDALPKTPIPILTDADRAAASPPPSGHAAHAMHDDVAQRFVLLDRLETWDADPGTGIEWEGKAWFGTDRDRLWLRSEGEGRAGRLESADVEALYGRAISPWWDAVVGVRHDFKPGASQDYAAIGLMGLSPYKFEVSATAYIGTSGRTAARVEVEYETLLTNRLILQPLVEANFHGREDPARMTGAGLGTLEAGLRLRYEINRRFAPYIGIVRERAYGRTAEFRRAHGEDAADTHVVAGVRFWF